MGELMGGMSLTDVLDEIDAQAADARTSANWRVRNVLKAYGWFTADADAGYLWGHPKVPATLTLQDAVDIQCAWERDRGR